MHYAAQFSSYLRLHLVGLVHLDLDAVAFGDNIKAHTDQKVLFDLVILKGNEVSTRQAAI